MTRKLPYTVLSGRDRRSDVPIYHYSSLMSHNKERWRFVNYVAAIIRSDRLHLKASYYVMSTLVISRSYLKPKA
jgi:ABC-type cobalamin transport system ATPase subunit